MLSEEIAPHYLQHIDFPNAKEDFLDDKFSDFEDLLILNSAARLQADRFITNDKKLLALNTFQNIIITTP